MSLLFPLLCPVRFHAGCGCLPVSRRHATALLTFNRQGPDEGTQYRSAIFYSDDEQKRVAEAYIQQLNKAGVFSRPIVTAVTPLAGFYDAEEYHQHFIDRNPNNPYIVYNDLPKLKHLQQQFPELLKHR